MARLAKEEAARRAAALAELRELQAFFGPAGVAVKLSAGDLVTVQGRRVCGLLALTRVRDWEGFVNRVAAAYCAKQFVVTLHRNLHAAGAQAFYDRDLHGFRLEKERRDLAVIWATSAVVWAEGEPRTGNFLVDGPHWDAFRREFEIALNLPPDTEPEEPDPEPVRTTRPPERPRFQTPPMNLINAVPEELPFDLAEAALDASRRLREERRLVFDHEVVLHYRDGDLKLKPLRGSADALQAPFVYTRLNGVRDVRGMVALSTNGDPLAVRLDTETAGDLAPWIWACALLGLASVTCIDIRPASPRTRTNNGGGRRSWLPTGQPHYRRAPHSRSVGSIWPSELRPVGRWAAYTASYVAGHARRLYDGRSPSAEARERARAVGLSLGPDETYVRPHTRGLPDHAVLEFDWHCQDALLLSRP